MVTFQFINTVIDSASLLLIVMVLISFSDDRKKRLTPNSNLLLGTLLAAIMCILNLVVDGIVTDPSADFLIAVKSSESCLYVISMAIFCLYQFTVLVPVKKRIRRAAALYFALAGIWCAADIAMALTGTAYQVHGTLLYPNTHWYYLQCAQSAMMVFACIIVLITPGEMGQRLAFTAFNAMPAIGYILIWYYPEVAFDAMLISVEVVILYISCHVQHNMRLIRQELQLQESRNAVMNSQIKPHFLYNAISAIVALCREDGNKGADMLTLFGKYLRANLDSVSAKEPVPFSQELKHIKCYVELEQARLGERLNMEYTIRCDGFSVPMLSIQPLVENAIRHGISETAESGTVHLCTWENEEYYMIGVVDNGCGFVVGTVPDDGRSHIGLANVRERLSAMVGGSMEIESTPGKGTEITVKIPKEKGKQ